MNPAKRRAGTKMDILFHAVSAGVLARHLGEFRKSALVLAALVGANPDILTYIGLIFIPKNIAYPFFHSLFSQIIICLVISLLFNPRIAFGGLLHILIDVVSHRYSTSYLLCPFMKFQLYTGGLSWYRGNGIWIWVLFWIVLVLIVWRDRQNWRVS